MIGWHTVGTLPVLSNIVLNNVTDSSFRVDFTSTPSGVGVVEYGTTSALGSSASNGLFDTRHQITVSGLTAGTHYFRAVSRGHDGSTYGTTTVVEVTSGGGPTITSGPTAVLISDTEITVDWTLDVVATGQVFYGSTLGGPYPSETTREDSLLYSAHSQTITGLTAGATYYAIVESSNAAGGTTQSDEFTWTMQGAGQQPAGTIYGGGITMTGLANVIVGRDSSGTYAGPVHAQQFRAQRSLTADTFRFYRKAGASGYSNGDGGEYEFFIVADAGGEPDFSGTRFGEATKTTPNSNTPGDLVTFGSTVALASGTLYRVVMKKTGGVGSDYVSWNGMNPHIDQTYVSRYHPRFANDESDFKGGVTITGTGTWAEHYGAAAQSVWQIVYSDGHAQGNSYMEHGVSTGNGTTGVTTSTFCRQTFQPYDAVSVTGVGVRASQVSGGTLSAILKTAGGSTLQTATFASASRFPSSSSSTGSSSRWDEANFAGTEDLAADTEYVLEFQNTTGTVYICNLRKGSVGFSYSDRTEWHRGIAEASTNTGSTWTNIGSSRFDLPAYLIVE